MNWLSSSHLIGACFILAFAFLFVEWVRDLSYYRSNNWDFSKNSGRNYFFEGEVQLERLSNKKRVLWGFPSLFGLFIFWYFSFV
jgi:hypothetical protein